MTPVSNAYISYTQASLKRNFFTKNVFFLLICLHLHLIDHIRKQKFVGEKILQFYSLDFERIFNFWLLNMQLEK